MQSPLLVHTNTSPDGAQVIWIIPPSVLICSGVNFVHCLLSYLYSPSSVAIHLLLSWSTAMDCALWVALKGELRSDSLVNSCPSNVAMPLRVAHQNTPSLSTA